jgi:hypothetical protein
MQGAGKANFPFPKGRSKGNKIKKRIASSVDCVPANVISILIVVNFPFHVWWIISVPVHCLLGATS